MNPHAPLWGIVNSPTETGGLKSNGTYFYLAFLPGAFYKPYPAFWQGG
jgi:hypothetical protein